MFNVLKIPSYREIKMLVMDIKVVKSIKKNNINLVNE